MDKTAWLKVVFDTVVILNALAIICWIFLAIFPGIYYFSQGDAGMGFQLMILNFWFYFFAGTLIGALILHFLLEENKAADDENSM